MSSAPAAPERAAYTPPRPTLIACACTALFVLVLCAPMFAGKFLVGPVSDQYVAGYGFRDFWTEQVRGHGSIPLWNPYIFGGLPYVAAMHGDLLYPFTWIRLFVPTDTAMNLTFFVHLVLAGFFAYLFLRSLGLPWAGAVVGGLAYQLSGQLASLVHPGHDGKLYVSAMLPLALLALVQGVREGRWAGFGLLGLATGLALLSPSVQMAYYMLLAAGIFALYLAFFDPQRPERRTALPRLGVALGAVLVGVALSAVQILPFLDYLPFSPRAAAGASTGWEYATSYSLPPEELLNTLLPEFSGHSETYWGRNPLKYHGEYLGVVPLMLTTLAFGGAERRRLRGAFIVLAAFFLLVSLGGHTPFYRLVYELLPFMKKVRAPSMAFFVVSLSVAAWAAMGAERALAGQVKRGALTAWLATLVVLVLLGLAGVYTNIARPIAEHAARTLGDPARVTNAVAVRDDVTLGVLRVAVFGTAMAALLLGWARWRVSSRLMALALPALVGLDLWSVERRFFVFSPPAKILFAPDEITRRIEQAQPPPRVLDRIIVDPRQPYRVLNPDVYRGAILMAYDIPQVLGYHGNEIRFYDDLLGGKNVWSNLGSPKLWELLAVRFIVLGDSGQIPGYTRVLGPVHTTPGRMAYLYEADTAPPYARVVPAAVKGEPEQIIPTLLDPRLDFDRLVLFDPDQPVNPPPVNEMPAPSPSRATVASWEPGRMAITLAPAPPAASYLLVAENWYPDWRATVDGTGVPVLRGNYSLLTVPVPAGARRVELVFRSDAYRTGKLVSLLAALLLGALVVAPRIGARRRAGRGGTPGG